MLVMQPPGNAMMDSNVLLMIKFVMGTLTAQMDQMKDLRVKIGNVYLDIGNVLTSISVSMHH